MEQQFSNEVLRKLKKKRSRKIWRRILSAMMCLVVFWTTYALILPAITMESTTFCGMDEHTHDEGCYETALLCQVHVHSEACYESRQELICQLSTEPEHKHSEECNMQTHTELHCTLEENDEHTHDEGCYTTVTTYACGQEEIPAHIHTDACYETITVQICTLREDPAHEHTDECYGNAPSCQQEAHTHTLQCYSDPNADLEEPADWQATLPGNLTGVYAQDILAIARSQLGYTESDLNYTVDAGGSIKGYTRYGAWYGDPYGDWNSYFAAFCLAYAGAEAYPVNTNYSAWVDELDQQRLFQLPSEYIPNAGDLIFFDQNQDGIIDRVGFVEELVDIDVVAIEGDSNGRVAKNRYDLHDHSIVGYGIRYAITPPVEETPVYIDPDDADAWAELEDPTGACQAAVSLAGATIAYRNSERAGTPLDLTPYILNVAMYDRDGNPIPSGSTVTEGDLIEFRIEYTIDGQQMAVLDGKDVSVISNTLTYKLPEIFELIQGDEGNIVNSTGQTVGTYVIDNVNGTIVMWFSDEYVEQNATGMQIHGNISFFSTVKKVTESDDEHQDYQFTDKITIGVNIEENDEAIGDLKIEKQATSADGEVITYEVKVTSTEGTNGQITITDQMATGLTFLRGLEVKKADGSPVNANFQGSAGDSSFTITLPEMAAGESYTIRYQCTADIDLLDTDMTVHNTATVTGKDSDGKELKDEVTVDYTFDVLKKTGQTNDDGSITWTITINQAKADISGWILEDILAGKAYTGRVTILGSSGNVVAGNVHLPYTFPQGSKDTYTITYTSTHGYGEGDVIYNKVILKDNDTEVTVLSGAGIGTPFTKSGEAGELIQDENGTNLLPITWTVTIDTTNGSIPAGEEIYDKMNGSHHTADMYMTYDQLMATIQAFEAELNRVGSSISYVSAETFVSGYSTGTSYNRYALENDPACKSLLYERFSIVLGKAIPQGNLLTFSYQGYGVFPNNLVEETEFKNRVSLSEKYEIEAVVKYSSGTLKATKYAINYYDPYANNPEWHWGTIHWEGREGISRYEYEKLHDSYLAWAIELSVPAGYFNNDDLVIYEDLPDGVSIKSLELPFQDNMPTRRVQIKDMAPGNTYNWTFTLYPAEQYIYRNFHDGVETTIVIKVTESGDLEITLPAEMLRTMSQYIDLYNDLDWVTTPIIEWYGYLYIYTQIKEDYEWTPTDEAFVYVDAFENRFTIIDEDGDVIDVGSQTQIITKDERDGVIRKEATTDNNNIITYSVVLNSYKKDLIENSGVLAIHDELTYTSTDAQPLRLRLVPGSVKLYEIQVHSDGSYTKLGEVTANYSYNESSSVRYGITTWVHTIDLNVPDSKALLLEYSYKATGVKNVTHNVLNTCTISGVGEGGLEGDSKVEIEVKEASAQADTKGVLLYKVDANSDGVFLENARFHIYIWNDDLKEYIIVHHPNNGNADFVTNSSGMIVLDTSTMAEEQFAYNTAYYIVEVESPEGYYLSPEPYYFYIAHEDTVKYPACRPQNFNGHALTSGDIIYRKNVHETTEISIEKYWKDYGGDFVTVTGEKVSKVTVELWQMLEGAPDSAKLYGTYTITPDEDGNWNLTITDLPKATSNPDGTQGTDYLYYIEEVKVSGYDLESTENNAGINSGVIKLFNREQEGYTLPETGGTGTQMYTMAGLLLTVTSTVFLLYIPKKRGRRNYNSS